MPGARAWSAVEPRREGRTVQADRSVEHSEPGFLRRAKYLCRLAERYARFEHKGGRNPAGEIMLAHLEEAIRLLEGEPRSLPVVEAAELAEAVG